MKTIQKDEVFQNLKNYLKTKGIELQDGSYTRRVEQGCGILAETVNLSQKALHRAKSEMDKRLECMRQVIHEKTAPKAPPVQTQASAENTTAKEPGTAPAASKKSASSRTKKPRAQARARK